MQLSEAAGYFQPHLSGDGDNFFFSHLSLFFAIKLFDGSISKSLARRASSGDDKLSCASVQETLQGDNKTPAFSFRFEVCVHVSAALSCLFFDCIIGS